MSLQNVPRIDLLFVCDLQSLLLVAVESFLFVSLSVGDGAERFGDDHLEEGLGEWQELFKIFDRDVVTLADLLLELLH